MLDKTHDLIIGAFDRHSWEDIAPWVNSLKRTEYSGKKAVILYNVAKDVGDRLVKEGYAIFCFGCDEDGNYIYPQLRSVVVERFLHMYYFLSQVKEPIRYVISTDVKDVIFQKDPSAYLGNEVEGFNLIVSGEGIQYKNEAWSKNNLNATFGTLFYNRLEENEIYCAGVLAGEYQAFIDLCMNIFLLCRGCDANSPGGGGPDQSALNILLDMEVYQENTMFTDPSYMWAINLGTSKYASGNDFALQGDESKLLYQPPHLNQDGLVCTAQGYPYTIVHQYNRVPQWRIREKYE